jgi:hypothetical protein
MSAVVVSGLIGGGFLTLSVLITGGFQLLIRKMDRRLDLQDVALSSIHDLVNSTYQQAVKEIARIGRLRVLDQIDNLPGPTSPQIKEEIATLEKLGP